MNIISISLSSFSIKKEKKNLHAQTFYLSCLHTDNGIMVAQRQIYPHEGFHYYRQINFVTASIISCSSQTVTFTKG